MRGTAKRKMDQYSDMLVAATGYEIYDMPVASIQAALAANGMDGMVQPTSRAMMTFLLYKWFPVPEARLFALMLKKAHALYWRDAEGGTTESVHDLWTRLKDCEDQAAIEKPDVAFLTPLQMRLLYVEGLMRQTPPRQTWPNSVSVTFEIDPGTEWGKVTHSQTLSSLNPSAEGQRSVCLVVFKLKSSHHTLYTLCRTQHRQRDPWI